MASSEDLKSSNLLKAIRRMGWQADAGAGRDHTLLMDGKDVM